MNINDIIALAKSGYKKKDIDELLKLEAPEPAPEPAVEEIEDRESMVAAISAAIATVMGEDVSGIRILSITRID